MQYNTIRNSYTKKRPNGALTPNGRV